MEYVYGAMLIHRAGKKIDEETMEKVLSTAGVEVDKARVKATVAALSGVDIDKVLKEAATVPAAATAAAAPVAGEDKKEAAKEKKKEEGKSPEEAAAGLGALFG